MNFPILIAASITSLAFLAHVFVGTKEVLKIQPKALQPKVEKRIQQYWMQSMAVFQLVSIDLLLFSLVLWAISLTDWIPAERELTLFFSVWFLLWGIGWLFQLFFLTQNKKDYLLLGQWLFCLVNAVLLYWGA